MIRAMGAHDVTAVAEVQVRAWREGYAAFVPEERMPTIGDRVAMWRTLNPGQVWVEERDGAIAGFVGLDGAEVKVLYVDPALQGRGVGGALLDHALERLRLNGHRTSLLWCLRDNAPGRAFCEHRGWSADGTESELWPGTFEVRYRREL